MREAINSAVLTNKREAINSALLTKLTRDMKDPAKRPAKRLEIRDTTLKGFILRVEPSGSMTYCMVYAHKKRFTIGSAASMDPAQARAKAMEIRAAHDKQTNGDGEDPIEKKQRLDREKKEAESRAKAEDYLTFLSTVYAPHLKATLRRGTDNAEHVKETMDCLERRFPEFHGLGLGEIKPLLIDKWIQRRADEVKPSSIKRQLNDLRACLNYAVKRGMLFSSPFDKMDSYEASDNERVRYLSTDEEARLRKALDTRQFADHLKPAVLLSLNTGLRRGELLKLKWENINFDQRILTVEAAAAKSAKTRRIKLNQEAVAVLSAWKSRPVTDLVYVFGGAKKIRADRQSTRTFADMRTAWEGVLREAEITDFRWHDLRHTFASKLVIAGVDLNKVRELLGHSDYKMTLRYAHLAPEHMQDAVDRLVPALVAV